MSTAHTRMPKTAEKMENTRTTTASTRTSGASTRPITATRKRRTTRKSTTYYECIYTVDAEECDSAADEEGCSVYLQRRKAHRAKLRSMDGSRASAATVASTSQTTSSLVTSRRRSMRSTSRRPAAAGRAGRAKEGGNSEAIPFITHPLPSSEKRAIMSEGVSTLAQIFL